MRQGKWVFRVAAVLMATASIVFGGGDAQESKRPESSPATASPARDKAEKLDRATLEKQFREMLTGVVFDGTWQMITAAGLAENGRMSEPRSDKYTLSEATKVFDDHWIIKARIQYADKDVTIPVPVRVVWAGDTPIITLDGLGLPGLGTYSARVMVYRDFYSGTWFGVGYGGVLSGRIVRSPSAENKIPPETQDK